jgi:hypothetical protein
MPVMTAQRAGEHTPAVEKALRNSMPSDASLSTFGVRASGSP